MASKRSEHLSDHLRQVAAVFMHRPFHRMPMTAFSIAYLYALGKGGVNDHRELEEYANIADVSFNDILTELNNIPNVSDFPDNDINRNAFPIASKVMKTLLNDSAFQKKILAKLDFGQILQWKWVIFIQDQFLVGFQQA